MSAQCYIIPPWLTDRLPLPDRAEQAAHDAFIREWRQSVALTPVADGAAISVYDSGHTQTLPHTPALDSTAAAATAGLHATHELLALHGIETSPMVANVHYGRAYDNAFWDGTQMVFGDGDGKYFGNFAQPIDVCAHERQHGVTGNLLDYQDQAGALNESLSDCVGAVTRQRALGLSVTDPEAWLIGSGLLLEAGGRALRDMLAPGTAYNTAALGNDPQPAHMRDYVKTSQDNGGVHLNSGIPNRAFALAAAACGNSDEVLGIWLRTLLTGTFPTSATFDVFAAATVKEAAKVPGNVAGFVAQAWSAVGVAVLAPAPAPAPVPLPPPGPAPSVDATFVAELRRMLSGRFVSKRFRVAAQAWLDAHPGL